MRPHASHRRSQSRVRLGARRARAPLVILVAALTAGGAARTEGDADVPAQDPPATRDAGASPAASAPSCAERAARLVQSYYEGVDDLRARFEQTTESVALGTGAAAASTRSAGEVIFAKPGRMRWHYEEPAESLVVTDGEVLWIVDPVAAEAQRLPVSQDYLSGAALQFLLGEGDLLAEFSVTSPDCGGDPRVLALVPRGEASYERLVLRIDPATGRVRETEVVDLFGNVTRVRFSGVRTNTAPGIDTFRYEPPDGMRVTDLLSTQP